MTAPIHTICPACDSVNRIPAERLNEQGRCGKCHQPLFSGTPLALNETRFDWYLTKSEIPLLVDFWAPWCAPCRMMAPAFEKAAQQLEPKFRLIKINTEESQNLGARFNIRSIPTLALFKGGREVARQAGAMDTANIVKWVLGQN